MNACSSRTRRESYFPEFKAATLAMVRAQGAIVGWTATADAVIAALARDEADRD